ncbi:MAG: hypothetical protein ABR543_16620 [Gemmatimonadaceae bacterium]
MAVSVRNFGDSHEVATPVDGERGQTLAIEWPIYAVALAAVCIVVGLIWDISWHRTIGRDTFWSPPHLLEQIAAVIAGFSCGYVALRTSFAGGRVARDHSVRFWKFFHAPLGAWVCVWGTIMMITSAPFDDWWHNAYGLDVEIISPPHMVLALGMLGIQLGAILLALAAQNRAETDNDRRRLGNIFAFTASVVIVMGTIFLMEDAGFPNEMHGSDFYILTAAVLPIYLVGFARASGLSWPATRIAMFYMIIVLTSIWVLQLFPAQAKLAPIYNPVTRMVPPPFPLLLIFPALAIDVLMRRFGTDHDWLLSLALGVAFVTVMLAAHWFWAEFMLSPAARNFFFAADQWDYNQRLGPWRYTFWNLDTDASGKFSGLLFAKGLGLAVLFAVVLSRAGLWWGKGMSKVRR